MLPESDRVRQAFKAWDVAGSGEISTGHLLGIIRRLDPSMPETDLEALFGAAGVRDNGCLVYEDFLSWLWSDLAESPGLSEAEAAEEAARARGLWEGALADARSRASGSFPADRVRRYFDEVQGRLTSEEYAAHVKGELFGSVDFNGDGRVSFSEAAPLIGKSLRCAADLSSTPKPGSEELRAAFKAHDTLATGRGYLAADEFLNLQRYLQVRVAEAMLPFSKVVTAA